KTPRKPEHTPVRDVEIIRQQRSPSMVCENLLNSFSADVTDRLFDILRSPPDAGMWREYFYFPACPGQVLCDIPCPRASRRVSGWKKVGQKQQLGALRHR